MTGISSRLENTDVVIFDSDGVLVEEGEPLPGAVKLVQQLNEVGKLVIILSNNSTKHPSEMKRRYHAKGIKVDNIVNSSIVTAKYCKENGIKRVFVVGEPGLIEVLQENNITYASSEVDAVIVGMDRDLTYQKLATATHLIRDGALFIATNPDRSFPTSRGLEPGAGSMIAALVASTDKDPDLIIGKPSKYGYEYILQSYEIQAENCMMIGDRFETDIAGALQVNMPALIVNTGIAATRENPGRYKSYPEVDVIESLTILVNE